MQPAAPNLLNTFVGVDEHVDPAQSTPKGRLCATGGFYPPLRFGRFAPPADKFIRGN